MRSPSGSGTSASRMTSGPPLLVIWIARMAAFWPCATVAYDSRNNRRDWLPPGIVVWEGRSSIDHEEWCAQALRRNRDRCALRRRTDRDVAGPQGVSRVAGGQGDVSERHDLNAYDPSARRCGAEAVGSVGAARGHRVSADHEVFV